MSKLSEMGSEYRKKNITKNTYNSDDPYVAGHKNALSDGDVKGKGLTSDGIGSSTDIQTRTKMMAKNKYNSNSEYNAGSVGE